MSTDGTKNWNSQWWGDVAHKKTHALPTLENVRAKKKIKPPKKK